MRIIAIANQKGGCGKTTTSINFAASLARLKKKVILADFDPQGHSTCGLGVELQKSDKTLYHLLCREGEATLKTKDVLYQIESYLALIPSDETLAAIEEELVGQKDRDLRFRNRLKREARADLDADYLIMDCPPQLGVLTYNALEAADEIIIPVEPSFFSLHGLAKISETLSRLNQNRVKPIEIHALLTLFNSKNSLAHEVYEEVKKHFGDGLFKSIIHDHIALKEAACSGQSIVSFAPESQAFKDFYNMAIEYLERNLKRVISSSRLGWDGIMRSRFSPKHVCGGILFQVLTEKGSEVEIAGDFNHWVPEPLVRRNDPPGLWQKVLPITSGSYRYKYIVNGEWQVDPCQVGHRVNVFGGYDSYLEIVP
ncbi:MAG: hypothetical protein A2Z83_02250 [Omnitrophica bacterium GWA2_52_8]|nr:MAG: hypothetical protein A2Z83_02250 [Omnitrophica bacterium GWA2_52_8]